MDIHLDASLAPLLWAALSLAVVALSAQLSLTWFMLAPAEDATARAVRLVAGAVCMGTGVWSIHGITGAAGEVGFAVGHHASAELGVWLAAVAAAAAALGWFDLSTADPRRWLSGAVVLGLAIAGIQVLGVLTAGWQPGIAWQAAALLYAALVCVAGCALAFALLHALRVKGRLALVWGRGVGALLLGAAAVYGQHLIAGAADLPSQTASSFTAGLPSGQLAAFASIGTVTLLLALRGLLMRVLRKHREGAADRRKRSALSLNDTLTGLPTRQLFEGTLAQAVRQADAGKQRLALLFLNLDGLKPINQSYGHPGGDKVLREVASRVRALSKTHMAARLAGDEFLTLLTGDPSSEDAAALAARLIAAIGEPFAVDGREVTVTCSIGVAMYPEHGAMSTMINHAHAAMTAAKAGGGASHAFFEPRMIKGLRDEVELLRDLRVALDRGQLELYYQPKIHAPSGEVTGAEALMRWHHPQRGMISPGVFIPLAERYGLISALGRWVIDEACRQARAWRDEGLRMRVAINLSVHQLRQPDLAERIGLALQRHQINPDLLTCEVTESSAMDDTEVTTRVLKQLDEVGVHLSIDDFGTGHSSLAYLRKLPADELKIDRSFVLDLETSEDARKVALAVINLAKSLDLKVVAEGVETEAQNRILREFGCDQLQGYLFAKPMSAKALALWAMDDVGPRTLNFRDSLFKETRPSAHA